MTSYDITIVGSGIVGAAAALLLAKHSRLRIAVLEVKNIAFAWDEKNPYDHRVSAISHSSKKLFQALQVWEKIQSKRLSSYTEMHVWDAKTQGQIHFDSQSVGKPELGFIIEDSVIRASLLDCYSPLQIDFLCPFKPIQLVKKSDGIEVTSETGQTLKTTLLIAADGANSWVRQQVGIEIQNRDYLHTAIVATVQTEKPHQKTAWQRFLPTGPLAFLPLSDPHHCSIVWSATHEYAAELMTFDDNTFCERCGDEFENRLGKITGLSRRHFFPLRMRHAKQYVQERVALIGDAAHTIHPLAGQGVNMGLLDAASLVEIILDAHQKNRQFSSLATLRKYERWRKSDTTALLAIVDGFRLMFGSDNSCVKSIRSMGLNLSDRLPFLKICLFNMACHLALVPEGSTPNVK